MFFNITRHERKASFRMFFGKVRASKRKLEINDPKLPKTRKVSSHYEEGETLVEFCIYS